MGTRADFYVGRGEKAEWLGSVAYDGNPVNFKKILETTTESAYRAAVNEELKGRDDATLPEVGWPWPWTTSEISDYAYAFDTDKVWHTTNLRDFGAGKHWMLPGRARDEDGYLRDESGLERCIWPDMSDVQKVTLGQRSGAMFMARR